MTNATFKDGKLHGSFETYHDNGTLKERGTYHDDCLNGIYETWHDNGTIKERGNFSDGKRHGLSEWHNESGILKERGCWKDGLLVDALPLMISLNQTRSCDEFSGTVSRTVSFN